MGDFGTGSTVNLADLAVGDIIFTAIKIDKADMANPKATSGTAKKIKRGEAVDRFCVVLSKEATYVTVTYLSTFAASNTLPATLDKAYWYPVDPATKEGTFKPLPALNTKAQWASLRTEQHVSAASVLKYSVTVSADSASKILHAMK